MALNWLDMASLLARAASGPSLATSPHTHRATHSKYVLCGLIGFMEFEHLPEPVVRLSLRPLRYIRTGLSSISTSAIHSAINFPLLRIKSGCVITISGPDPSNRTVVRVVKSSPQHWPGHWVLVLVQHIASIIIQHPRPHLLAEQQAPATISA